MEEGFIKDLKGLGNADLIYQLGEMKAEGMEGAADEIRREMVVRFCQTHWSYIEELMERDEKGNV